MNIIPLNQVDPEAKEKVSVAKISLLKDDKYTFFSSTLMKLSLSFTTDVPMLATDGLNIFINPDFINTISNRKIAFGLMHECMHVMYNHLGRQGSRDQELWNIATDYVINNQLDYMGLDVIEGICLNHSYDKLSADEIYANLKKQKDNGQLPQGEKPTFDDFIPPQTSGTDSSGNAFKQYTPEQRGAAIQDIVDAAVMAAKQSGEKAVGNIPADVLLDYNERMQPKINWKEALADFLFVAGKQGSSFKRPSRRGLSQGLALPGKLGKGLGRIDFAIDTSGSVSKEMFTQFLSELAYVLERFKPKEIGISQFDTEVKQRDVVNTVAEFETIQMRGGGGTDVAPVLAMYKDIESKAMIILTDGYFYHNESMNPHKPVVWCIYDNPTWVPPFGEAIHFKL